MSATTALIIDRALLPRAQRLVGRLRLRGVPLLPLDPPFTPKSLRLALNGAGAGAGWLLCADPGAVPAAATAGLVGVVLVDADPPADDHGIVVARADDPDDAPRVMIPKGGGCWH